MENLFINQYLLAGTKFCKFYLKSQKKVVLCRSKKLRVEVKLKFLNRSKFRKTFKTLVINLKKKYFLENDKLYITQC